MTAKDFAKKAGLSKHGAVSIYRWESGTVTGPDKILPNIKKMIFEERLTSVLSVLKTLIAEVEGVPEKIDFIVYPNEALYKYFNGEETLPFILHQEANDKIIAIMKKLGIVVSSFEITQEMYTRWLQNKGLEDSQQNRSMFVGNYG